MGIPLSEMVTWDFNQPNGGLTEQQIRNAKIILWNGHCSVHQVFKPEQIDNFLAEYPDTKVIAIPKPVLRSVKKPIMSDQPNIF